MDLTAWLLGRTPVRPMIATAVGATDVRLAVERELRRRGWRPALNPAEANLLVVAGQDDPVTTPFVDAVWQLVPAPRVRIGLADPSEVAAALSEAERRLRSRDEQRSSAAADTTELHDRHAADSHSEHLDHGHHHGHDMGGMELPGGIPMADRADDRDGLKLDRLTVPLGPVLPAWPPGLLVRLTLQGDVVQEAVVETVPPPAHRTPAFWDGLASDRVRIAARRLDSCSRLLTVAGWEYAAVTAARLRDHLLDGDDVDVRFGRWARQVRRSRVLRWSLTGIGVHGRSGDARDRLLGWVDQAAAALDGTADSIETEDPAEILDALPALLAGAEFAAARLVVASFDPDLERRRIPHG